MLSAATAEQALAEYPPDTDGEVPLVWECFAPQPAEYAGSGIARTGWTTVVAYPSRRDPREYRNEVHVDWCLVYSLGGGPLDLLRIYRHEMAHAKDGREHREGSPNPLSPDYNPAYRPNTPLTGL